MPSHSGGGFGGGGRSGGGGFGGGGFSGGSHPGGSFNRPAGGFGPSGGHGMYHGHPPIHHGPHYSRGGCGGCAGLAMFAVVAVIMFMFVSIGSIFNSPGSSIDINVDSSFGYTEMIPDSTIQRKKMDSSLVKPIDAYINDQAGVITDETALQSSMEYFYEKTGVQPYVHIMEQVSSANIPEEAAIEKQAYDLWYDLFEDEGHYLVMLVPISGYRYDYYICYLTGDDAWMVVDDEASNIFMSALNYYYNESNSYDKSLQMAFTVTADRIMGEPGSNPANPDLPATPDADTKLPQTEEKSSIWGYVVIAVLVTGVVTVVILAIRKKKEKELEAEDDYEAYKKKMDGQ